MRFTDGFWLLRDGVRGSYATEVRDPHVSDTTSPRTRPFGAWRTGGTPSTRRC
ncbi:hypothetical protein ACF1G0_09450 [Streptomyces sp. NPDC013953]|uniref:hypothetical protein n=1 Tax=Streptomyces sp. NPDC013953 TaxID=3364868 RepID=UPI0036F9FF12